MNGGEGLATARATGQRVQTTKRSNFRRSRCLACPGHKEPVDSCGSTTAFNDDSDLARNFMVFVSAALFLHGALSILFSNLFRVAGTLKRLGRMAFGGRSRLAAATAVAAMLLPAASGYAQAVATNKAAALPPSKILADSLVPAVGLSSDLGQMPSSAVLQHMEMYFAPTATQKAALTNLLQELHDPSSPLYHKWLTPAEFKKRFGASAAEVATAEAWLRSQGFTIESANAESVRFSGTVSQVDAAFQTQIHNYKLGSQKYFANSTRVTLPTSLTGMVRAIGHLNSLRPVPLHRTRATVQLSPNLTDNQGNHFTVPEDLKTIYDINPIYNSGYTGAGQEIAVVGQSLIDPNDIALFDSNYGGNANLIMTLVPNTGDPTITSADDEGESDLDIEYSGSIAPDATVNFVFTGNNGSSGVFDAMEYAIEQDIAPIISISYGACEPLYGQIDADTYGFFMDEAATQGQTLIAASGDAGATACDQGGSIAYEGLSVQFPSDSPDVTGVGGTEFNEGTNTSYWNASNDGAGGSATSYIPEMVWNDDATSPKLSASGGGASTVFSKPTWQAGTGVPSDEARDVPDIALDSSNAHDPYFFCGAPDANGNNCANGYVYEAGGTSFAAPIFAGITALIDQSTGSTGEGNINSSLYQFASSAPSVFHDITVGNNDSPCASGTTNCTGSTTEIGYSATTGYDQTTGLGSIDALLLAQAFPNYGSATPLVGSSITMTTSPSAPNAGSTLTFTATVASASSPSAVSGNVQFLVDGVPTGDPVALSNDVATTTITPLTAGSHIIVAQYLGNSSLGGSATSTVLNVAALPPTSTVITLSPAMPTAGTPITVTTMTSSATAGSPTGTVDLSVDGNDTNNPVTLANGATTVTLPAMTVGAHVISAQYSGDSNYSASTGQVSFNVVSLSTSAAAVSVTPSSPTTTDSVTATAAVTAGATGTVQFLLDGTAVGSPVTLANGTAQYGLGKLAAGSHTVTVQYSGDGSFAAASGDQTFIVSSTASAFTLTAGNVTMGTNDSASSTVTVTSTTDYAGTVQLAVSGSGPSNACYLVDGNPTVSPQGTATTQISFYTGNSCTTVPNAIPLGSTSIAIAQRSSGMAGTTEVALASVWGAGFLLFGLRRRRRALARLLVLLAVVSVFGMLSGCGGSGTKPTTTTAAATGTYTLTVKGVDSASSSNTATTTMKLTIQ